MTQKTWIQLALLWNGAVNALAGVALLLAPGWFFSTIGTYPPFNQHYSGDGGAFLFPIGVGLLLAWREPRRHSLLIGIAALSGTLHAANHLYDDFILGHWTVEHLVNTVELILQTGLLGWAWWVVKE